MTASPSTDGPWAWRRLALAAVLVAAGLAVLPGSAAAQSTDPVVVTNETVPDDQISSQQAPPESDRLAWENGVWYNATLAVDQSDGIQRPELRALIARTMARTERIRGLEFDRTPPVRVISREQAVNESSSVANLTESARLKLNAQYEALFMIPESTDAIESREAMLGAGIGGYYAPSSQSITMVSPEGDTLRVKENVLSQELFHALQDQKFNVSGRTETIEQRNAFRSAVEGDANYVQYLYEQRCTGAWNGTCYIPTSKSQQGSPDIPDKLNLGMYQTFLHPYNSGVAFVRDRYQARGWEAVNELYERPPESTEQVIHPAKYPDEEPTNLTVADRSSDEWEPLTDESGTRVVGSAGEAGLFVSLWYPAFQSRGAADIISLRTHFVYNESTGKLARPVTYQYNHTKTAGWNGDTLLPYVTENRSIEQMGYVYETTWDSEADAEEFASAYRELLAFHDAENVSGHANTYRLPDDSGFEDAIYLNHTGNRVTIVNAPTVADLSEIRPGAAPEVEMNDTDGPTNATNGVGTTATETPANGTETAGGDADGESGPGFGVFAAALALALTALVGLRARE